MFSWPERIMWIVGFILLAFFLSALFAVIFGTVPWLVVALITMVWIMCVMLREDPKS